MNRSLFSKITSFLIAAILVISACSCTRPNDPGDDILQTEAPSPTPVPRSIENESVMASSIVYANEMMNKIQCFYDGPERDRFIVKNENAIYEISLKNGSGLGLDKIKTESGKILLDGGMTGFYTKTNGRRFESYLSTGKARVNTSKMGYYYYEVNLRDVPFSAEAPTGVYSDEKTVRIEKGTKIASNMVTGAKYDGGAITGTVSSGEDPYVYFDLYHELSGNNLVIFDLSVTGGATSGEVYYAYSGSGGINADDHVNFKIAEGVNKQTVYVYIPKLDGNKISLTTLRFDLNGSKKGDTFRIENIRTATQPAYGEINCGFEQTLHSYSDKVNSQIRILFDEKQDDLSTFGFTYRIPSDTVGSLSFMNASGEVFETVKGEISDFQYAGFEIKGAGILGFIAAGDGGSHSTLRSEDGYYVIELYKDIAGLHKEGTSEKFGHRIYTSSTVDFDALKNESYIERNPVSFEVTDQAVKNSKFKSLGFNYVTGAYELSVAGTDFSTAYRKSNVNKYYGGTVKVHADSLDRKIYFMSVGTSGCLEAAAILDENKILMPIQTEVCKNFQGEFEEPYYDPEDTQYGYTVYPLVIKNGTDLTYTMLNMYQNWGVNRLKQLSSIAFHIGYYHLSTGVTESNCIAPYFVYGRDGWTLPDFRGCSGVMWTSQPQYNSVGRLRFMSYKENGEDRFAEYVGSDIRSSGPVYADLFYSYRAYDSSFDYTLRHVEFPSNDENRTYYTLDALCIKDVTINDARNAFTLFSFDPRSQCMLYTSYKSDSGSIETITNDVTRPSEVGLYRLAKDTPYFSLYNYKLQNDNDVENFGYIVRSYDITIGGKAFDGNLLIRNSTFKEGETMLNLVEVGIDQDVLSFKKGDRIKLVFILLPFGVKKQDNDQNVRYVIEDSVDNPWRVSSCEVGTPVEDDYLIIVDAVDNVAEFTVTGSRNSNAVRVNGFSKLTRPKVSIKTGDGWSDLVLNVEEFDGYQVNYTYDGFFSYSFIVNMENFNDSVTLRVTCD